MCKEQRNDRSYNFDKSIDNFREHKKNGVKRTVSGVKHAEGRVRENRIKTYTYFNLNNILHSRNHLH